MSIDYSDEKKYNKQILDEIKESYDAEKIVPFIGSGFSKNVNKDYPDWSQFIDSLSIKLNGSKYYLKEKFPGTEYLIRAADYFSASKYQQDLANKDMRKDRAKLKDYIYNIIKDEIEKIKIKDTSSHRLLLELDKCQIYFTTNWDKLIENTAQQNSVDIECVSDFSNLIKLAKNGNKKILIKMHGCIDHKENIIVSETDYFELSHNKNHPINVKFQNELFHKDFLFIGFSFTDPNISNLTFPAYLIKKDTFKTFEEPKIFLISFGDHDPVLAKFFIELRGIYLLFLDVPKNKRTNSINVFFEYLLGKNKYIKTIIDKTNLDYKKNMKKQLKNSIESIENKIHLFSENKNKSTYSTIKTDLESEIKKLEYNKQVVTEKLNKIT